MFSSIICLDDLLRKEYWQAKNFFYDLIREPIKQVTGGYDIKSSPRNNSSHNLCPSFDEQTFLNLINQGRDLPWNYFYYTISKQAEEYLIEHIPTNCLILSYEMPPWLEKVLLSNRISFIDIRISPLRFASDLYIALRTNNDLINSRLVRWQVCKEEILLEASLVAASVRHSRRHEARNRSLDGVLVYVGQTPDDASLVDQQGSFLRPDAFSKTIVSETEKKKFVYKPHPNVGVFAEKERQMLSNVIGTNVELCYEDIYELLGADDQIELIGISSSSLQEAYWFDKPTTMLYKPICPILTTEGTDLYSQVRFLDFISPIFWHSLCVPNAPVPKVEKLSVIGPNALRKLHNMWWGYSNFLLRRSRLLQEAHYWSGGWKMNKDIQELQKTIDTLAENQKRLENLLQQPNKQLE